MSALMHFVRTDARHFRFAIGLWTVLVVAEVALTAVRPRFAADMRAYGNIGMILGLLWAGLQIGMLLIVPLIVQADPAVGTDAFWMTRPVPPRALFAAKLGLLAAVTVLLPCAARLVLMLWVHVPLREALFVTLDMAISSSAWLAVLIAGAALTLNLPRFALLCGAVVVCFVLLITISVMRARPSETAGAFAVMSAQPVMPPVDDPTEGILFLLCLTAAGLALTALQYRTRLRRVSVPAGAGALALAIFAIPHWPMPLLKVRFDLPAWTDAVHLLAPDTVIQMDPLLGWIDGREGLRTGRARVVVGGLEPGWAPTLELRGVSAALEHGTTLPARGRGFQSSPQIEGFTDNPDRVVAREVLGVARVFSPAPPRPEWPVLLALPAASLPATLPAPATYRGQFVVRLAHWEAVAALPLRTGATFQDAGYRVAIEQIVVSGERLAVRAQEWRATSSFDRKPLITYAFYVRNAQHTSAMAGNESEAFFEGMGAVSFGLPFHVISAAPSSFSLRLTLVSFPPTYGLQEQKLEWDPAWYADAELVIIRITQTGAVVRPLDVPQATLKEREQ